MTDILFFLTGMNSFKISKTRYRDISRLVEFYNLVFKLESDLYEVDSIILHYTNREALSAEFRAKSFYTAEVKGKIAGSVRTFEFSTTCYITKFIVHPIYQISSIYTELVCAIECAYTHVAGFEIIIDTRNNKIIHCFGRLGYTIVKLVPHTPRISLMHLQKKLY